MVYLNPFHSGNLALLTQSVEKIRGISSGFLISAIVALAAQFLSDKFGMPAMLLALLLGMSVNFLGDDQSSSPGVQFSAKAVLRFGIALLGARVSIELASDLGFHTLLLVTSAVVVTIIFALIAGFLTRQDWSFAVLTGGAVAICGASAAIAISSVLPERTASERNLIFTILGVTVLSTIAMIVYPVLTNKMGFAPLAAGIFLGGAIHDVAQVVGAGFTVSSEAGEIATVVKLLRVTMLAPIVLLISLYVRAVATSKQIGKQPPLVPLFVVVFLILAAANSAQLVPESISVGLAIMSQWALLTAIVAVGMKTSLRRIFNVGSAAIVLIVAETLFIGIYVFVGTALLLRQ